MEDSDNIIAFWKKQRQINLCIFAIGLISGIVLGADIVLIFFR